MIINLYLRKTDPVCTFKETIENYLKQFHPIDDKIFINTIDVDTPLGFTDAKYVNVVHVPSATVKVDDKFNEKTKVYSEEDIQILLDNIFKYIDCVIKLTSI